MKHILLIILVASFVAFDRQVESDDKIMFIFVHGASTDDLYDEDGECKTDNGGDYIFK